MHLKKDNKCFLWERINILLITEGRNASSNYGSRRISHSALTCFSSFQLQTCELSLSSEPYI